MKPITITRKLIPFTHQRHAVLWLPFSCLEAHIYPTKIFIKDLNRQDADWFLEVTLDIKGPVKNGVVLQNLEKGFVQVCGDALDGYFHYVIFANNQQVGIQGKSISQEGIAFSWINHLTKAEQQAVLKGKETHYLNEAFQRNTTIADVQEDLSLGDHQKQNFDQMKELLSMDKIFPIWLRYTQFLPEEIKQLESHLDELSLVQLIEKAILEGDKQAVLQYFEKLLLALFKGLLLPHWEDNYEGVSLDVSSISHLSPLVLLSKTATLIRKLFYYESDSQVYFLPCLPIPFHCGRLINIPSQYFYKVHMEWSKKTIRRIQCTPKQDVELSFVVSKKIKRFRMRYFIKDAGIQIDALTPLILKKDTTYFFDNFEK